MSRGLVETQRACVEARVYSGLQWPGCLEGLERTTDTDCDIWAESRLASGVITQAGRRCLRHARGV